MGMKRGVFFSIDALIALTIIFLIVLVSYPLLKENRLDTEVQSDIIASLTSLSASEFDNVYVQSLISQGVIKNPSRPLIEIIGEFYVTNRSIASNISQEFLAGLKTNDNVGIWYENTLVASKNTTSFENATSIQTARQIISGVFNAGNGSTTTTGFSARALLSNDIRSKYYYFGGYFGEGNISTRIEYNGTISSASMEAAVLNDFDLYVNNILAAQYSHSPSETEPSNYTIPIGNFQSGVNIVELRSNTPNNLSVAGGFIKIKYQSDVQYEQPTRYYFPGIRGIINVYDGFYIPNTLEELEISLHYKSNQRTFLTIGNTTVYNSSSDNETTVPLSDAYLDALLDYNSMSNKTVPIRFGLENVTLIGNGTGNADVVLITDVSGSMDWQMDSDNDGTPYECNNPLLYTDPNAQRLSLAKCLDMEFVSIILGAGNGNRVALVSFSTDVESDTSLITNINTLNSSINSYVPLDTTCISCGINRAYEILAAESNPSRSQFIVTMSDGVPNVRSTNACYNYNILGSDTSSTYSSQAGASGGLLGYSNSWYPEESEVSSTINGISLASSTLGYGTGSGYTFIKYDGIEWTNYDDLGSTNMYGIDLYNETFGFAVGDAGIIARLLGTTWAAFNDTGGTDWKDVAFVNSTYAFAVGDGGDIYRWAGGSWAAHTDTGTNMYGIDIYNRTFGFATATNGRIYIYNGTTWTQNQDLGGMVVTDVDIYNSTLAFATTDSEDIYRWNSGTTWTLVYAGSYDLETINIINSTFGFAAGDFPDGDNPAGFIEWNGNTWTKTLPHFTYAGNNTNGAECGDGSTCSWTSTLSSLNANYSSCRAHNDLNATVFSIGFGPVATCTFGSNTLQSIAQCGGGSFYASSNASQLQQIYQNISQSILTLSYFGQTALGSGNITTELFSDSYIEFTYPERDFPFGLHVATESPFVNSTTGFFNIPSDSSLLEAQVVSYSGSRWTSIVKLNNNTVYNLSTSGNQYSRLGDPYQVYLPSQNINTSNTVSLMTGYGPQNITSGSDSNKIIYTVVKNASGYSPVCANFNGCNWTIEFDSGEIASIPIPSTYTGPNACSYTSLSVRYDQNDAAQYAAYRLLHSLDLQPNNKVDAALDPEDISISLTELTGIPFAYSAEVQVRAWI